MNQGRTLLQEGRVGCLILAGGQGSRLGFKDPKGMMPVSVIRKKSLFQILCEKVLYASLRYHKAFPLAIMTSSETHARTELFFKEHRYFGLSSVSLFQQGVLPVYDEYGNKCGDAPCGNGHALHDFYKQGLWHAWSQQGVTHLIVIPVDNALAVPLDVELLQYHERCQVEVSLRAIKRKAKEHIGMVIKKGTVCEIIEYSELTQELALNASWGNTGIYCFSFSFIEHLMQERVELPIHHADKMFQGRKVRKQEYFLFDVLPYARSVGVLLSARQSCFSPLKQAVGENSLTTVQRDLLRYDRKLYRKIWRQKPSNKPFELSLACLDPDEELMQTMQSQYKEFVFM